MRTSVLFKKLWFILMITVLLSTMFTSVAFADGANPPTPDKNTDGLQGKTVPPDPNRVLSPEETKLRDAKYRALEQHIQEQNSRQLAPSPNYIAYALLSVGTWKEPNDDAHINYCGPGATQVALDARWPASSVYGIDQIGVDENTDRYTGTSMEDIVKALNTYLAGEFPNPNGFEKYWWDGVYSRDDLGHKLTFDIDDGYATITGVMTTNMPGWNGYTAQHIVAVIGYKINTSFNDTYVYYTETAANKAGYYGVYRQTVLLNKFWNFVSGLPTLAW